MDQGLPLEISEYETIRRIARKFALRMKFYGEEDDFASYAVTKAWELQRPINYRFTWFHWLRERYSLVRHTANEIGERFEDLHVEHPDIYGQHEETAFGAQATEPKCEEWTRLAREIGLRPHTIEYAVFILFFSLGFTPKEIAYITGYTRMQIYSYVKVNTRDLSEYYDVAMIRRRTNRFR